MDEKEHRRIQKEKIEYWHAKADEAYAMKCAKFEAEIERYKPYVNNLNATSYKKAEKATWTPRYLFTYKYFFILLCLIVLEIDVIIHTPDNILSLNPQLLSIVNYLSMIAPKLGHTELFTLKHHEAISNPEMWRVYSALAIFVFVPIKTIILTKWFNSLRQTSAYRGFVTSPLTVVRGLTDGDVDEIKKATKKTYRSKPPEYRSILNRIVWSTGTLLMSIGFCAMMIWGDNALEPFYTTVCSLLVAISLCIIKDYLTYFKLARSKLPSSEN